MSLLSGRDFAVAIKDNYARQLKRSVTVHSFCLENVSAFKGAGKAGDRDGSNTFLV